MLTRAYSVLTVKAVDDEQRIIEGLATTPETDRVGDVVEPDGAVFKLPIPLLWQHRSDQPIGHVISAQVTKAGIKIKAQIAKDLLPRIEEAWALIRSGLVRGLSIGFNAIEHSRIDGTYGLRFIKWEWLELSAVTIPANAGAGITSLKQIKQFDAPHLAATGTGARVSATSSGAPDSSTKKAPIMKTISEKLTAKKAELKTKNTRLTELMQAGDESGQPLEHAQRAECKSLSQDVNDLSDDIETLEALERAQGLSAKSVRVENFETASAARSTETPRIEVKDNTPAGIGFARYVICKLAAHISGGAMTALDVAKARYPHDARVQTMIKAAVAGATTTDANSHGALVDPTNLASEFIEYLRPMTIVGKFGTDGIPSLRRVPFNVRVVGQTSGGSAYWVGQAKQKPLTRFNTAPTTLLWAKIATIAVIADELAKFSSPAAEGLVRDELAKAVIELMDKDFIAPSKAAVSNVSPASITNGLVAGTPSGTDAAAVRADLKALLSTFLLANQDPTNAVLILPNTLALALSLMTNPLGQPEFPKMTMKGGTLQGLPVIASQYAAIGSPLSNLVIIVNASEIFLSDDGGVSVDASREASLEMSDDPENESGTVVSMFQTNQIAIRAERYINWAKRRPESVAYLDGVAWGDAT